MPKSLLFLEKNFFFSHSRPHPGRGYALSSPFGWAIPECFLYRVLKALRGSRKLPAVLSWEGEAVVVPSHPHVVMPKMTTCYWKSEVLLEGIVSRSMRGPTCLEKSWHACQVCSMWGLRASIADKTSHAVMFDYTLSLIPQTSQGSC